MTLGRPFHRRSLDRLIEGMRAALEEFGEIRDDDNVLAGAALDPGTRRLVQGRRLRAQAVRALETPYYGRLFDQIGLDPGALTAENIATIPVTAKETLREDPAAFVRRGGAPAHQCGTTGTTGRSTMIWLSDDELHLIASLSAITYFQSHMVRPDDRVVIAVSPRNRIAVHATAFAATAVGASVDVTGMVEPEAMLARLSAVQPLPGHKPRTSVLTAHPSYLAALVETGEALGRTPADFGLERVIVGGELLTAGLRRRAARLFGDAEILENYALTELVPFAAGRCERGHYHFEPATCLVEALDLDDGGPAAGGAPGTLVGTPLPPFRDTTVLLRYDTEDVVRLLDGPADCAMGNLPAVAELLGKRRHAVRHEHGWTFTRPVAEALEALDAVPLPARYGMRATTGGVAVEAVVRSADDAAKAAVEAALAERGVPLAGLRLVTDPDELRSPLPLRCDLREGDFGARQALVPAGGPRP
ncbi:phenylacetate--CoA ligase family protein [Actinomadura decatromicini]|uniref:AMP-dependent synthetase/ligase domain-containing protein n=1 Tax=Actinomadura decatromicini TaxID=2604572 RepID=A0A5D3FJR9_9ACTN|nr:AMP-binding protein [Actinomadura decatromicini]TYK49077.1 hypothetical protein FXF68_14735 [Actinomadura decatromicini]